jgi:hypothetical protein
VALWLADADALAEELALALAESLDEALAVLLAVLLAVAVELAEPLAEPVKSVSDAEGLPPPVQAESATQASTVIKPAAAVSLTRCAVRAMAVRAFIEPPHALGNDHFPVASRRNRRRTETITVSPGRGANRQWRAHHRNIRLLG